MTINVRPGNERGHANHGWLDSYHTFSFAHYHDPAHMGYRTLRVINDDIIQPQSGFDTHGHRDMEIVTYVVSGMLTHQDSTGGKGTLQRGDVQSMSAGTGIRHSEWNASETEACRLLQIWILPERPDLPRSYQQRQFAEAEKRDQLRLIAAPGGLDGALPIQQDALIYASILGAGKTVTHSPKPGRGTWVQVVDGQISVNGQSLVAGDGASIELAESIVIQAKGDSDFLLFDLI